MSNLTSILDDINKLNHFGPVSGRNKIPNFHLVNNEIPSQRKEEYLDLPKGFESALNEEDVAVEPDYELISLSVRQVMKPYSYSNAKIEEKIHKKYIQQENSSRKRNQGKETSITISDNVSENSWRKVESKPNKNSLSLNPECEEFNPTEKVTRGKENCIVPSDTAVKSKSQPFLNPNVSEFIPKYLESTKTGSSTELPVTKSINIEPPPEVPKVKEDRVNKKRVNVAMQSILQFNNLMEEPKGMNETNANKSTSNKSEEQPPAFRRPFKPEEIGFSDITKSNKLYEEGDVEEPFRVQEKCISWMKSNDAIKSGKISTFKPHQGIEIDMLTLLNMSDDNFAFKPKTKSKNSDTKEIKDVQNAPVHSTSSKSCSLVTQPSYGNKSTIVHDQLSNNVTKSDINNHCGKQITKDKYKSDLNETYSDNASNQDSLIENVSLSSNENIEFTLNGNMLQDDSLEHIENEETKGDSVDSIIEILSNSSIEEIAYVKSVNISSDKQSEKELIKHSLEEIDQYSSIESLTIDSSAEKSFCNKNIFNKEGFENGVSKNNLETFTDSVDNSSDKIVCGNHIKERQTTHDQGSSSLNCNKYEEIKSTKKHPEPKIIITSKSTSVARNSTKLGTSSPRDYSPPLCKEELKTPLTLSDKNIIYRNLLNLNVSNPEDQEVGEFEKNTIWAAVSSKLRKKKKK